jgi:hypothetical protein
MKLANQVSQAVSVVVIVNLIVLLVIPPVPILAQTSVRQTSPTDFVLINSDPPGQPVAQILLENLKPIAGNGIEANLYIKVNTAIAYMVNFQQFPEQTLFFEELSTLPLYQSEQPIFVSQITLMPGEKIVIQQDKLGNSPVEAALAIAVDLSLFWMYLIGQEKIPTNSGEGISSFFQAYTNIPGWTGFFAELGKLGNDIRIGADQQVIEDNFIDLMLSDKVREFLSAISEEIFKTPLKFGNYLNNFFDWYNRAKKIRVAYLDLTQKPHHIETTITLVPFVPDLPEFPVVDPQSETEIIFRVQNISGETWKAGDYSLVNIGSQNLSQWSQIALDIDVPSGYPVEWRIPVTAPAIPGVYRTTWQFSYKGVLGGPPLWADLIVVPGGSSGEFIATIQGLVDQARQSAVERFEAEWARIREQIIELIWLEITRIIRETINEICGGPVVGLSALLAALLLGRHRRSSGSQTSDDTE